MLGSGSGRLGDPRSVPSGLVIGGLDAIAVANAALLSVIFPGVRTNVPVPAYGLSTSSKI
jgi:hypothetical protein